MCTAHYPAGCAGRVVHGANMDFSYLLTLIFMRFQRLPMAERHRFGAAQSRYRLMGIGQKTPQLIFADGVNEMGLAARYCIFPVTPSSAG